MATGTVTANGITIWYETFGNQADPAVLLIMGLGSQGIAWPDPFCEQIAAEGRFVIRYDNRDVGLSQWFDGATEMYTLDDMADDAADVLDALGVERAHIVGVSMGGMIAQLVALDHSARAITLTSIMSTPGGSDLEPATEEAMAVLGRPAAETREERIAAALDARRVLAAGAFQHDQAWREEIITRAIDRAFHPAGTMRQTYAIVTAPARGERLRSLQIPTLVIHGTRDPLIPFSHGVATAKEIPGATLHAVDDLGHELPPSVWQEVAGAIIRHTTGS